MHVKTIDKITTSLKSKFGKILSELLLRSIAKSGFFAKI